MKIDYQICSEIKRLIRFMIKLNYEICYRITTIQM